MTDFRSKAPEGRPDLTRHYRRVWILESRDWFEVIRDDYDVQQDLVLTFDFGLKHEIESIGGQAGYVDHLVSPEVMQENNFRVYAFFRGWHWDEAGRDLFEYQGVPFGMSFRIDYWNDLVFYARTCLCLQAIGAVRYDTLHVGTSLRIVEGVLGELALAFAPVEPPARLSAPAYFFPIHAWMAAAIRHRGVKALVFQAATVCVALAWCLWDRLTPAARRRPAVFVQHYFPTQGLIERLLTDGRVRVVGTSFARRFPLLRYVPQWRPVRWYQSEAARQMEHFRRHRSARLVLTTGLDITAGASRLVMDRAEARLAPSLRTLDSIVRYLRRHPLSLAVLIGNIGETVALIDCVCRARGIPTYLIINGLLGPDYLDESKYATVINAYSPSIQQHYFRGMTNTVALGDPRMDRYPPTPRRVWPSDRPVVVTIGASGHNNIDLNSYVAVEFDFIHQTLQALARCRDEGMALTVVVKVRANGYRAQYEQFAAEYFPGLVDQFVDQTPMRDVLARSDFFISIYSQTLFEAACLGIPCVYYRADNEVQAPPFDGRSELVVADSVEDLVSAIRDASVGGRRFDGFLTRAVMERYIGPLDGGNTDRNLQCLYRMAEGRVAS